MIAFHYPPQRGSSGIQRSLIFSQYLPEHCWESIVLSAHPRAYEKVGEDKDSSLINVHRAFALDAARHLSIFRRYLRFGLIENGHDEEEFIAANANLIARTQGEKPWVLVHC